MRIVDTNIILRYVLADHEDFFEQAKLVFMEKSVVVPVEVLCEVVYVLESVYNVLRRDIYKVVVKFFDDTGCILPHKNSVIKGLGLYTENKLDFVDCILAGYAEMESAEVFTFDRKLEKLIRSHIAMDK